MINKTVQFGATTVDLISTVPILLDGTQTTVDGVTVADNMYIYASNQMSALERAVWWTTTDHTQPWALVSNPIYKYPDGLLMFASNVSGANSLKLSMIEDTSTGLITVVIPSNYVDLNSFQTVSNKTLISTTLSGSTLMNAGTSPSAMYVTNGAELRIGESGITTAKISLFDMSILRFRAMGAESVSRSGIATLSSGSYTVPNTISTSSTVVIPTVKTPSVNVGALYISSFTAGSSFTIKSTNSSDTSVISWFMIDQY